MRKICMLLLGKEIAKSMKEKLTAERQELFGDRKVYLAIIFLGDNAGSKVYVQLKKQYAESLGLGCKIF